MSFVEALPLLMIATLIILLFSGFPVGGVLAGIGLGFAFIGIALGEFPLMTLFIIPQRIYGTVGENLIYPAVPMLLFMGIALETSGAARELLVCLQRLLVRVPGSLCVAVILLGLILAPTAGLIGASVATLALAALPTMLDQGYRPEVATGSVAGAGTLGVIAPPAIMLFFLGDALGVPIATMFLGPILPVLGLAIAFMTYYVLVTHVDDTRRPRIGSGDDAYPGSLLLYVFRSLVLPVGLIVLVLGSIIAGWVAPTESAAVGAIGAAVLIVLYRGFSLTIIKEALVKTVDVTAMVFFVVIGASIFSFVFRFYGGDDLALALFDGLAIPQWGILATVLTILFVLGFFIDWIEITLVSLPILYPVIQSLDFSAYVGSAPLADVWIAVLVAVVLQTSFLTPPFGFALFFLKGAAPPDIRMIAIYRGIVPLVAIQLMMVALIVLVPALATWLPDMLLEIR